MTYSTNYNSR